MTKRIILVIVTIILSITNFVLFTQYGPPIIQNYYYLDFMFNMSPFVLVYFILIGIFYYKQAFIKHYIIANVVLVTLGIVYLITYYNFLSDPGLFDLYVDLSIYQLIVAFYAVYVSVKVSQSEQYLWPVYTPMVTINSIYALLVPALWHERIALSITALLGQNVYYWIMIVLYLIVTASMVMIIITLDIDSKKVRKDFDKEVLYERV